MQVYCSGELLACVQMSGIFEDSKEFVDMPMRHDPEFILNVSDIDHIIPVPPSLSKLCSLSPLIYVYIYIHYNHQRPFKLFLPHYVVIQPSFVHSYLNISPRLDLNSSLIHLLIILKVLSSLVRSITNVVGRHIYAHFLVYVYILFCCIIAHVIYRWTWWSWSIS